MTRLAQPVVSGRQWPSRTSRRSCARCWTNTRPVQSVPYPMSVRLSRTASPSRMKSGQSAYPAARREHLTTAWDGRPRISTGAACSTARGAPSTGSPTVVGGSLRIIPIVSTFPCFRSSPSSRSSGLHERIVSALLRSPLSKSRHPRSGSKRRTGSFELLSLASCAIASLRCRPRTSRTSCSTSFTPRDTAKREKVPVSVQATEGSTASSDKIGSVWMPFTFRRSAGRQRLAALWCRDSSGPYKVRGR